MITEAEIAEAFWEIWWEKDRCQKGRADEYWRRVELSLEQHEIAEIAWRIWEKEGRQDGRALEYWSRAEQQLLAAGQQESSRTNGAVANRAAGSARVIGSPAESGAFRRGQLSNMEEASSRRASPAKQQAGMSFPGPVFSPPPVQRTQAPC